MKWKWVVVVQVLLFLVLVYGGMWYVVGEYRKETDRIISLLEKLACERGGGNEKK